MKIRFIALALAASMTVGPAFAASHKWRTIDKLYTVPYIIIGVASGIACGLPLLIFEGNRAAKETLEVCADDEEMFEKWEAEHPAPPPVPEAPKPIDSPVTLPENQT